MQENKLYFRKFEGLLQRSHPDSKIFDYVRQHLNHRNINITERYLNFDSEIEEFNDIQESFSAIFDKGIY